MHQQTIYPALRYSDTKTAIAFLERAFGFVPEHIYPGDNDSIAHAQLRTNRDIVMLGTASSAGNASPKTFGGECTLSLSLCVAEPDALCAKAIAGGATIVLPLHDTDYGSRSFAATDCEGYEWTFGTYAPSSETDLCAGMRYDDAPAAIAWLRDVCGFRDQLTVPGAAGRIAHAEMAYGASIFMLGSRRNAALRFDTQAAARGITGSVYAYADDPDAVCARARAQGATIVREPVDMDYGSREFSMTDPEGNTFSFGTYRP